ncbi:zinc finger domain-containing protein [Arthrobacter russicus]|uniref:zinc finger domain-containing protein n=1 Tax=Arthrobacter russicus TaxID=172040 RepID=UPI003CEE942C
MSSEPDSTPTDADEVERQPCPRCLVEAGSPCRSRSGTVAGTYLWMFALGGGILAALYVVRWESEPSFLEGSVTSPAWKQFFGSYRVGRVCKPAWCG